MRDVYNVIEILKDIEGKKVTWTSQDYIDYRTAHRIKTEKNKVNSNPCVKYEIKLNKNKNVQAPVIAYHNMMTK